jgi:hypothetical protein
MSEPEIRLAHSLGFDVVPVGLPSHSAYVIAGRAPNTGTEWVAWAGRGCGWGPLKTLA